MLTWNGQPRRSATAPAPKPAKAQRNTAASSDAAEITGAILRAIPDLMFILKTDGTFVDYHARDESLLFAPPAAFLGKTVREIMPPEISERVMQAIAAAVPGGEPIVVEYDMTLDEQRSFEARIVYGGPDRMLTIVREVTETKRAIERNRDLAGRLITAQEGERTRIARDLHDGLCQEVASVTTELGTLRQRSDGMSASELAQTLYDLQRRSESIADSLRLLSHDLHPSGLRYTGLVAALRSHCVEVERQHEMKIAFVADGEIEPLRDVATLSMFRIAQEALRNAALHGLATQAQVTLRRRNGSVILTVADFGKGFDVAAARNGGLGLVSIEERARLAQGSATFESRPGLTTVRVEIPHY